MEDSTQDRDILTAIDKGLEIVIQRKAKPPSLGEQIKAWMQKGLRRLSKWLLLALLFILLVALGGKYLEVNQLKNEVNSLKSELKESRSKSREKELTSQLQAQQKEVKALRDSLKHSRDMLEQRARDFTDITASIEAMKTALEAEMSQLVEQAHLVSFVDSASDNGTLELSKSSK